LVQFTSIQPDSAWPLRPGLSSLVSLPFCLFPLSRFPDFRFGFRGDVKDQTPAAATVQIIC
jgi:hypothetical protein